MQLQFSAWPEVETYLKKSRTIVIPVGSMEQHGPTGFIGTDALCPEIIALRAAEENDVMVAPTFSVGVAQHHMSFAGSLCLRPSTMIAAMTDWTNALLHHGFDTLVWLNGHGGNIATINAAFSEIYHQRNYAGGDNSETPRLLTKNWWELPNVAKLCADLYPVGHGMHATISEVAVTYAAYPEHQKSAEMSPKIAPSHPNFFDAADYRRKYPDGRIGSDPSLATAEDGEKLIATAAKGLCAYLDTLAR